MNLKVRLNHQNVKVSVFSVKGSFRNQSNMETEQRLFEIYIIL